MVLVAKDIARKDFITLPRDTSALDAAKVMKLKGIQFVMAATASGSLQGIVTEWDYVSKVVAEGKNPAKVKLADIMSTNLVSVDASDGLVRIAELMTQRQIRRVLVFWEDEFYGVITAGMVLARLKEYVDSLSTQIKGPRP